MSTAIFTVVVWGRLGIPGSIGKAIVCGVYPYPGDDGYTGTHRCMEVR